MAQPIRTIMTFATITEAREYRHEHGTGGWIFKPDNGGYSILYPPSMTPTDIYNDRSTFGLGGELFASG